MRPKVPSILGVALVLALACDDKADDGKIEAKSGEAKSGDAKAGDAKAEVAVDGATDRPSDLCKAFDKDAVARAFGWSGLDKISGVGGSAGGVRHRTCSYKAEGAAEGHFGVTFSTGTEFEKRHVGFKVSYAPRAAVGGHETQIAKDDRVVILQMKTPELMITVNATEAGKTAADLEPKLEAAALALVGSLPPDAKAILEKK